MGRSKEEEREQTRFPCLALVRSLVAAGLTTLAVVVVVMVIIALHRPEKIILTTSVQTQDLWWGYGEGQNVRIRSHDYNRAQVEPEDVPIPTTSSSSSSVPAKWVGILVTVSAYNPSGRGEVNCTVNSISIIGMPDEDDSTHSNPSTLLADPVHFSNDTWRFVPVNFAVPPQTWYRHRSSVNITDKQTLQYLYDHYADEFSFEVMVRVHITTSKSINVSYNCGPVDVFVFYDAPADTQDSEVHCKENNLVPALAPAPAPAP